MALELSMTTATPHTIAKTNEDAIERAANYERGLNFLLPILAVLASFLVGSILLLLLKVNPIEAYTALIKGAFGTQRLVITTLIKSIPLSYAPHTPHLNRSRISRQEIRPADSVTYHSVGRISLIGYRRF